MPCLRFDWVFRQLAQSSSARPDTPCARCWSYGFFVIVVVGSGGYSGGLPPTVLYRLAVVHVSVSPSLCFAHFGEAIS